MIARWARLERIRSRQLDRARAEVARADAAVAQRTVQLRDADAAYLATASGPCDVGTIERALATIDAAHVDLGAATTAADGLRGAAIEAARAWQRADVALGRAKAARQEHRRHAEALAQDEHSARRRR